MAGESSAGWHLAQLNVARLRAPLDSPLLADFVAALEPVNAAADCAPGFVWRLQSESGNATDVALFNDPTVIVNLTVWESVEALFAFAYGKGGAHAPIMARRRDWFEHMEEAYLVLWWVPAGHVPSGEEAVQRLEHLRREGPSPLAFTFKQRFPPPAAPPERAKDRSAPRPTLLSAR